MLNRKNIKYAIKASCAAISAGIVLKMTYHMINNPEVDALLQTCDLNGHDSSSFGSDLPMGEAQTGTGLAVEATIYAALVGYIAGKIIADSGEKLIDSVGKLVDSATTYLDARTTPRDYLQFFRCEPTPNKSSNREETYHLNLST